MHPTHTIESLETRQQSIDSNINHLLRVLKIKEFFNLSSEYQQANLEECDRLLKESSKFVSRATKGQLVAYLQILTSCTDGVVEDGVKGAIDRMLDWWNHPSL